MSYVTGGEGPPVVFFHGIGASSYAWRLTLPALLPYFTVYAPDMLGCGESDKPAIDYSITALATYAAAFMDAVGLDRAHIIGHSLGGGVALQLSALHPDRIDRLALVASGGIGRDLHWLLRMTTLPGAQGVLGMLAHPNARLTQATRALERRRFRRLQVEYDNAPTVLDRLRARDSRQAFLRMLRGVSDLSGQKISAIEHLATLTCPALIIWGGRDRTIPVAHARLALAALPSAHLDILPDCFHRPQIEAPGAFNAALLRFLTATTWPPDTAAAPVPAAVARRRIYQGAGVPLRRLAPVIAPVALAAIGGATARHIVRNQRARRQAGM
jgi:pimeloyl-ACP methyl ester carboxylesterase